MNLQIPAQYAKFVASLIGLLVTYLQAYGAVWHLVPAIMAISASLGVMGVPNKLNANWVYMPPRPQPLINPSQKAPGQ